MKALALDIGNRYIGVAATDHVAATLAYRYATIDRKNQDMFAVLKDIVERELIDTFILGVPYHIEDGSETGQTRTTKEFIASLQQEFGQAFRYIEVDETLTSLQAKENLKQEGIDISYEHAEAARILLQEFLIHGT